MVSKNRLQQWKRNIREIYLFSDTDLLEFVMALVMIIINPISMYRIPATPACWAIVGIIAGLGMIYGILERNLAIRYWAIKAVWIYLLVIIGQSVIHWNIDTNITPYAIQLCVTWLIFWKTRKQLDFYRSRKK